MSSSTKLPNNLTEGEVAEFREIFNLVDKDKGGSISKEELGELMDTLGISATHVGENLFPVLISRPPAFQDEIDSMINEIDQDNNGEIDFDGTSAFLSRTVFELHTTPLIFQEFVAVMSRKVNASYTPDQVKNAFKVGS